MRLACFLGLALSQPISHVLAQSDTQIPLNPQTVDSDCHNACTALVSSLGSIVYYDSATPLQAFQNSYYANQQREVIPACIVTPFNAQDVSLAIQIITQHNCIFAVKSGGHAMFPGASNAPGGITFDMRYLNDLIVNEDRRTTKVGTGNTWGDVYKVLDPLNITVVGGRDSGVGVGGFTLGGGISFLSRKYGWAADNVHSYEVVLANGTLADINLATAPDLYWALRGGGNNFGIVTSFTLETYPQALGWGSFLNVALAPPSWIASRMSAMNSSFAPLPLFTSLRHNIAQTLLSGICKLGYCSEIAPIFKAFLDYALAAPGDENAQVVLSIGKVHLTGFYIMNTAMIYSKPVANPPVFDVFKSLPILFHNRAVKPLSSITREVDSLCPPGNRNIWSAVSFKVDEKLLLKLMDIFIEEAEAVAYVPGGELSMSLQLLNREEIRHMQKNGGNCLGIQVDDWPLIVLTVTFAWNNKEDDIAIHTAQGNIVDRITAEAKERGLHHRYIYQNYANISQDVFAGYGEENRERLRRIQSKWDPKGVFSRLQPGYFKV